MGDCGISNIYFDGKLEDWTSIKRKLDGLTKYDVDGELAKYVKHVGVIIDQFIDAYQGKVDLEWWNQIMVPHFPGSGTDYVDGWILNFFGIYGQVDFGAIPKTSITVPIKLIN